MVVRGIVVVLVVVGLRVSQEYEICSVQSCQQEEKEEGMEEKRSVSEEKYRKRNCEGSGWCLEMGQAQLSQ